MPEGGAESFASIWLEIEVEAMGNRRNWDQESERIEALRQQEHDAINRNLEIARAHEQDAARIKELEAQAKQKKDEADRQAAADRREVDQGKQRELDAQSSKQQSTRAFQAQIDTQRNNLLFKQQKEKDELLGGQRQARQTLAEQQEKEKVDLEHSPVNSFNEQQQKERELFFRHAEEMKALDTKHAQEIKDLHSKFEEQNRALQDVEVTQGKERADAERRREEEERDRNR